MVSRVPSAMVPIPSGVLESRTAYDDLMLSCMEGDGIDRREPDRAGVEVAHFIEKEGRLDFRPQLLSDEPQRRAAVPSGLLYGALAALGWGVGWRQRITAS